jgi:cob(I)alamin adenosyltransferase
MGRLEQEEKSVAMKNMVTQLDKDITQLQSDVVDQNEINHVQQNKISYLEKVVEAMDDRLTKFEARLSEVEDIV